MTGRLLRERLSTHMCAAGTKTVCLHSVAILSRFCHNSATDVGMILPSFCHCSSTVILFYPCHPILPPFCRCRPAEILPVACRYSASVTRFCRCQPIPPRRRITRIGWTAAEWGGIARWCGCGATGNRVTAFTFIARSLLHAAGAPPLPPDGCRVQGEVLTQPHA